MGASFMTVRTHQIICVCNILMGNLLLFNWGFPTGVHQSVGMFIVKITMVGVFQESAHSLCCDMGQNDTIGKIELIPAFVLSKIKTNC